MTTYRNVIKDRRRVLHEHTSLDELDVLREQCAHAPYVRSLVEALSGDRLALFVEPKRATAERGVVNEHLDVAATVTECERGGAHAISIVTESVLSHGSISDLITARESTLLPIIARDFIVHPRQVLELRAAGADALMLPMFAFVDEDDDTEEASLDDLLALIHELGMTTVVSVRTPDELEAALGHDIDVLTIDNRDDNDRIDTERTFDMLADVPVGTPVISESVADVEAVSRLRAAGVDALLLDEGHVGSDLPATLEMYRTLAGDVAE